MNEKVKILARNGIIAALYVALTWMTLPLSYGLYQFRVSEILVLLCFFRKDYTFGLVVGCAIANVFSPEIGVLDVVIGSAATLIACLGICFCKHLALAAIIPVVANAFIVGAELVLVAGLTESFWYCALWVGLGELSVMIVGYILYMILKNRQKFYDLIEANQNREFKF